MPQLPGPQVCTDGCCPCSSHLCRQSLGLQSYLAWDSWNAWQCKCSSHALLRGTSHGAGTYRLRHFWDYKHIFGGPVAFNGTSSSFEVHGTGGAPHKKHHGGAKRHRFQLSDWELYVREHGFLIPVVLFALLLVGTVLYRQAVSRQPVGSSHPYDRLHLPA